MTMNVKLVSIRDENETIENDRVRNARYEHGLSVFAGGDGYNPLFKVGGNIVGDTGSSESGDSGDKSCRDGVIYRVSNSDDEINDSDSDDGNGNSEVPEISELRTALNFLISVSSTYLFIEKGAFVVIDPTFDV